MELAEYDAIRSLEDVHWWYQGLWALTAAWLSEAVRGPTARVLDAGCGTGGLLAALSRPHVACGVDLSPRAIIHCRERGLSAVARGSVDRLPFRSGSFDAVVSNDVLYHRAANEGLALAEFARVLRPGGVLVMNLPAFEGLRGAHDVVVHTRRRFTKPVLSALLEAAGFRPRRITYRLALLFPIAWAVRKLRPPGEAAGGAAQSDLALPAAPVNAILGGILALENRLLDWIDMPFGLSLFCLAEKSG